MKRLLPALLILAGPAAAQEPFTYETDARLMSTGDFNGDSRPDVVIVDRTDGTARVGFQQASGAFLWNEPQPAGIELPEALSVGRFYSATSDAIAVGSSTANRIHLIATGSAAELLTPLPLYPDAPGPSSLAAVDVDAAGNADLLAVCEGVSPEAEKGIGKTYEAITGIGSSPSTLWNVNFPGITRRIGPVRLKTGTPVRAGEIYQESAALPSATFYVEGTGAGGVIPVTSAAGVTRDTRFAWTSLDGGALQHVLFWVENSASLSVCRAQEPSAGTFTLSTVTAYSLGKNIRLIVPAPVGSTGRVVVLFIDGTAAVYDFTGAAAPVLRQSLDAGIEAVLPLGGGDFLAASGLNGAAPVWKRWRWNGAAYTAVQNGVLPVKRASSAYSNILFLSSEPFVTSGAQPRSLKHAREWSAGAVKGSGLAWDFSALAYGTSGSGLTGPVSYTLSGTSTTDFALINQYSAGLSIYLLDNRTGLSPADVIFAPPPGNYAPANAPLLNGQPAPPTPAVTVSIAPTESGYKTYYRTSVSADYIVVPVSGLVNLTATTTLQAFAERTDGVRTPVRTAAYIISAAGALVQPPSPDSDGDGMADAWEQTFNAADPFADNDGDGASNLAEFQGSTDPGNSASVPVPGPQLSGAMIVSGGQRTLDLTWPASDTLSVLQQSVNMLAWTDITTGITTSGGLRHFMVPLSPPAAPVKYYRLRRP